MVYKKPMCEECGVLAQDCLNPLHRPRVDEEVLAQASFGSKRGGHARALNLWMLLNMLYWTIVVHTPAGRGSVAVDAALLDGRCERSTAE